MVLAFTSQIAPIDCTHNLQKIKRKEKRKKELLVKCSVWGLPEVWR